MNSRAFEMESMDNCLSLCDKDANIAMMDLVDNNSILSIKDVGIFLMDDDSYNLNIKPNYGLQGNSEDSLSYMLFLA